MTLVQKTYRYGVMSLLILDCLEREYCPSDHPVFQLTPPAFHSKAEKHYSDMHSPAVTISTFWDIYKELLRCFQESSANPLTDTLSGLFEAMQQINRDEVPLLPDMAELRMGGKVVGDIANESDNEYASFTESDSSTST